MYNPPDDSHVSTGTDITPRGQFHYYLIHPGQRSPDSPLKSAAFTVDYSLLGAALPNNLGDATATGIDIGGMTSDVDLSSWMPAGVPDGAIISIRKIDSSGFKLIYTDRQGITYRFVDKRGELMTFIYEQPTNSLRLI